MKFQMIIRFRVAIFLATLVVELVLESVQLQMELVLELVRLQMELVLVLVRLYLALD